MSRPLGGKYQIGQLFAEGGFSKVYLAEWENKKYAVKVVDKSLLPQKDIHNCAREEKILKLFKNHPNIVQLCDFYQDSRHMFLVLEYMEGGELYDEIVRREFYSEREARDVIYTLLQTVHDIHKQGVVHR